MPRLLLFCTLIFVSVAHAAASSMSINTGEFGTVEIIKPDPPVTVTAFAFVLSGATGRQQDDIQAAQGLVATGVQVALIDVRETLKRLQKLDQECVYLPGPLEWISHQAQHQAGVSTYMQPMLFGRRAGAALVYTALAQAPPLSFLGGASVGFSGNWPLQKLPCDLQTTAHKKGANLLRPEQPLQGLWMLVPDAAGVTPVLQPFVERAAPLDITINDQPPALAQIYVAAVGKLVKARDRGFEQNVHDLPVIEVGSQSSTGTLVVIYSGDGGWRDLDRNIGENLAQNNYAVIGVDAMHYFWSQRTPEETAADLQRILEYYLAAWDCQQIVLVGYSFGADILPFAYNRLPQPLRQKVVLLSLLAPSLGASFEIHLEEWFTSYLPEDALPTAPETARIESSKLQCFYGAEDSEDTLCLDPSMKNAEIEQTGGGHHFDEDYGALAQRIEQSIRSRTKPTAASH